MDDFTCIFYVAGDLLCYQVNVACKESAKLKENLFFFLCKTQTTLVVLSLHAFKIPLTNLTPCALASSLFPPINLSLSATFFFFSCFSPLLLLSSPLCLVLFPLSHSHIHTNAHTPFAYPPPAPEVCEVVGACESRHTERGSCVPHLKPFAQSMLSASIWICVCPCVRLYLFTCQ